MLNNSDIWKKHKCLILSAKKLEKYWNSISFGGNAAVPIAIQSLGRKLIYKYHTEIETLINASLRDLKTIPYSMKMKQEFSFFADHVDRRQNQISFLKCQLFKNNDYCQPYTEKLPKTFEDFQYESSLGGFLSDPVKSEKYPGHYKTYVESFRERDKYTKVNDTEYGQCAICTNWIFLSATKKKTSSVSFCILIKNFARWKNLKRKRPASAIIKLLKEMFAGRNSQLTIDYINTKN